MMKHQRGPRFRRMAGIAAALGTSAFLTMPVSDAQAALALRLSSGGATTAVSDGGAGDFNPAANAVLVLGTVGDWTVSVASALSKGAGYALDITTQQTSSSSAGTLTIEVSDNDFSSSGGAARFLLNVGYALPGVGGSVTYSAYQSNTNNVFQKDTLIDSITRSVVSGASNTSVSGSASGSLTGMASLYSLTQVIVVNHNGAGLSSGNSELRVPEPGTLGLLGVGLLLLGFMGRFRKKRVEVSSASPVVREEPVRRR